MTQICQTLKSAAKEDKGSQIHFVLVPSYVYTHDGKFKVFRLKLNFLSSLVISSSSALNPNYRHCIKFEYFLTQSFDINTIFIKINMIVQDYI